MRTLRATLIASTGSAAIIAVVLGALWWWGHDFGSTDNSALHGVAFIAVAAIPAPLLVAFVFPLAAWLTRRTFQSRFAPFFASSLGVLATASLVLAVVLSWLLGVSELDQAAGDVVVRLFLFVLAVLVPLVMPWSHVWRWLARWPYPFQPQADMLDHEPSVPRSITQQRLHVAGRALISLLLGGAAVLGSMIVFRQGLLPLIDAVFHPGPDGLSAIRRTGIVLSGLAGYWAYVHWHEKRKATELRLRPLPLVFGAVGGAGLVGLPIAVLFALGAYEMVLFRGASWALWGVALLIGIAALLEELIYRCVLFLVLERAWGTGAALAVQSLVFAVAHLENVKNGGVGDVVTMLASVTLLGLLWGAVFVLTRNVWAVAAHHAAWNVTILLSGVPLSGIEDWRALAPIESRYAGPGWLTGGMFGPESSWLVMVSIAVAVVLLLRTARRRQAFLPPAI